MVNSDLQVRGSMAAEDDSYLEPSTRGPEPTLDLLKQFQVKLHHKVLLSIIGYLVSGCAHGVEWLLCGSNLVIGIFYLAHFKNDIASNTFFVFHGY